MGMGKRGLLRLYGGAILATGSEDGATGIAFWRIRPLAGVLLMPYLLWVTFAAALSYAVWHLNPQLLGYPLASIAAAHVAVEARREAGRVVVVL